MSNVNQRNNFVSTTNNYFVNDLFATYVRTFFRKNIVGGLKGFSFPNPDTSDWIIHARYLLTEIRDEHIAALFDCGDSKNDKTFSCTASWISALLKKEEHIDQIGALALKGGNKYWSSIFYASLVLFDNTKSCKFLMDYLQNNREPDASDYWDSKAIAVYALRCYDKNNNTRHAWPYAEMVVSKKEEHLIETILRFSAILRGGIAFSNSVELQSKLSVLNNLTVSPYQYVCGLLHHEPIREIPENDDVEKGFEWYATKIREEYKAACANGIPYKLTEHFPFAKTTKQVAEATLKKQAEALLTHETNLEIIDALKDVVLTTQNPVTILSAIEQDLMYELPLELIELCFEKLLVLINPSYHLYEHYAIHLLLRGTAKDAKALALFDQSLQLKKNIVWVEEYKYKFAMERREDFRYSA